MISNFTGEYRFLSNFYIHKIVYNGLEYASAEHAYQAAKSHSAAYAEKIRQAPTAGLAKKLGGQAILIPGWDFKKLGIMYDILVNKFSDNNLLNRLVATGSQILVEGNTWGDCYWGKCNGIGENKLGYILMYIRDNKDCIYAN